MHCHHKLFLNSSICSFAFKTLENGYLLKSDGEVVERPQFLWMRVALQIHGANLSAVEETYDLLSQGYYIHATPTLKNSGTSFPQLASCFIQTADPRSVASIYAGLHKTAATFMHDGGVGIDLHSVPAKRFGSRLFNLFLPG